MGSSLHGVVRLALYLGLTMALLPIQALLVAVRSPLRDRLPRWYHARVLRIVGMSVEVIGTPSPDSPTLFVANHSSYWDIEVLGSMLTASFVAKTEVGGWPLFGLLARLQRTVFVERRRGAAGRSRNEIAERLAAGDSLVLFAEGTSSDGNRVLPFKSALFAAAAPAQGRTALVVQPVSIAPTRLDGIPLGYGRRALYAWYGDMDLAPHLWAAVKAGRLLVRVEFHPPVSFDGFPNRKALAEHCWRECAAGVSRAVTGRAAPPREPAEGHGTARAA
jgi:1-acyl-sn-glycerol-3-phosphate acyltransferase